MVRWHDGVRVHAGGARRAPGLVGASAAVEPGLVPRGSGGTFALPCAGGRSSPESGAGVRFGGGAETLPAGPALEAGAPSLASLGLAPAPRLRRGRLGMPEVRQAHGAAQRDRLPAGDDEDPARPFHPCAAGTGVPRCVAVGGVGRSRVARPGEVRVAVGVSPETGEEGGILSRWGERW